MMPGPSGARRRVMVAALALVLSLPVTAHAEGLAVFDRGDWRTWWTAERAPVRWSKGHPRLERNVKWERLRPGLELAEVQLAVPGPVFRIRLLLARIDTRLFEWELVEQRAESGTPSWGIDAVAAGGAFAVNAGQFSAGRPWGWIVRDGVEAQGPGFGPLSMALVVDASGSASLRPFAEIAALRASSSVKLAFQSYPTLLEGNGSIPAPLRGEGRGVDLTHRDSRLAIGQLRDGRLLVALTRFDIGGGLLRPVPLGPNVPEMAAIMGALGCRTAVMLDGGISSQLLARDASGEERVWRAYRKVPLGLVAVPRPAGR